MRRAESLSRRLRGFVALLALGSGTARAATLTVTSGDAAGEGFNSTVPRSPVFGNPGTTLGAQRLNVFQAAANAWGRTLKSNVEIKIVATFDPLFCDASSAVLGHAGPTVFNRDFPGAPVASTFYVIAAANSRQGSDADPANPDITATFNSSLDNGSPGCLGGIPWSYTIGGPSSGTVDLFRTVLHELAHGLGFLSGHDTGTGAKFMGFDDSYLRLLKDETTGEGWSTMTNAERLASQVNNSNLTWTGAKANSEIAGFTAGVKNGHMRMFAPNPVQPGSSVSHYDEAVAPNELQEPELKADTEELDTAFLLQDVGWLLSRIFNDGFEGGSDNFWSASVP
ncbi:MAG: hypothetical protein ABI639_11515 [Thermoanaerobaculia bacterium]